MELALLVYVVDLLSKLSHFLSSGLIVCCILTVVGGVFSVLAKLIEDKDYFHYWKNYYPVKTIIATLFLVWVIPSTQTMKYIAAGYLIQETFESEFVQETVSLSQKAVIKQLQTWAEDNTDIEQLLESVDIPVPEQLKNKGE